MARASENQTGSYRCAGPKGPRKNRFRVSRPGFGRIWPRRLSKTAGVLGKYVEDFAIEERPKTAGARDARRGSYSCAGPKGNDETDEENAAAAVFAANGRRWRLLHALPDLMDSLLP